MIKLKIANTLLAEFCSLHLEFQHSLDNSDLSTLELWSTH
jgi:hypothetical protein